MKQAEFPFARIYKIGKNIEEDASNLRWAEERKQRLQEGDLIGNLFYKIGLCCLGAYGTWYSLGGRLALSEAYSTTHHNPLPFMFSTLVIAMGVIGTAAGGIFVRENHSQYNKARKEMQEKVRELEKKIEAENSLFAKHFIHNS